MMMKVVSGAGSNFQIPLVFQVSSQELLGSLKNIFKIKLIDKSIIVYQAKMFTTRNPQVTPTMVFQRRGKGN